MTGSRAWRLIVSAFVLFLLGPLPTAAQDRPAFVTDRSSNRARTGKPRHPRLDAELNRIILVSERQGERAAARSAPVASDSSVAVSIHFAGVANDVVGFLTTRGAIVANLATDVVEAYVPVRALAALDLVPGLLRARAIIPPQPRATSQGVNVHNAGAWTAFGFSGAGVKVGIIDVGFIGYSARIGTEVPSPAGVRCYSTIGVFTSNLANCQTSSDHGTAVAEALHDVAPGAALYLSQPISESDLLSTAQWMIAQGVTVINHSVGWIWSGPGDGTSIYSNSPEVSVNTAIAGGSVWVNAAGNEALATWTGSYADQDNDELLEFSPGAEFNPVSLKAGEPLIVQARWDDVWGMATRDLDLWLVNSALQIVARSESPQDGLFGSVPQEALSFIAPSAGTYFVVLRNWSLPSLPNWIQVQNFLAQDLGYRSPGYSIGEPADSSNPGSLAAGAAAWYSTSVIEPYSSQGPTIDGRIKPDLVGADSADSATFGPSGFLGTSQAAPHVAGLAALVRQRYPTLGPVDVANFLRSNAQPRGAPRPNNVWGWGFAFLPTPVCAFALSAMTHSVDAAGGSGSVNVTADCPWTATSHAAWIVITSGNAGAGSGTVAFTVASNAVQNTVTAGRSGTISIAGQTFTVVQAGCSFSVTPTATTFDVSGGSGSASIATGSGCTWTVGGIPAWASTMSGGSGSGPGVWRYQVSGNSAGTARSALVTVAGQPFTLTQLLVAARPIVAGRVLTVSLPDSTSALWTSLETVARRSYCVALSSGRTETSSATPTLGAFRANATTPLSTGPDNAGRSPSACFVAPATETALFRISQADNSTRRYVLASIETTVWSNWFFIGGNYSSYTILRNTSDSPVAALITWRDPEGGVVGEETLSVPPRGVVYRDARANVASGTVAGSVEVAHDGRLSALVGSQTTLSATTGLSFDTLLQARRTW